MKYIFNSEELKKHLEEIFEIMREEIEDERGRHYLIKVLSYLFNATSDIEINEIKNKLEKISKIGDEVMTTIAMKLREEGKIEGRLEGERNKAIETARAMKSEGLDLRLIAKVTGLSIKEIEKL